MKPVTHDMRPSLCPKCGALMDSSTGLTTNRKPSPGDVTVCIACAALLGFDEQLQLSEVDIRQYPKDARRDMLEMLIAATKFSIEMRRKPQPWQVKTQRTN